jgi:hypothetical protein
MSSKVLTRRSKKKREPQKKTGSGSEIALRLQRGIDGRWPNLRGRLSSWMRVSREKLDDLYCSAAQAIHEHKEAFEDRLAERKAHSHAATGESQQQSAPESALRRGTREATKDELIKRSVVPVSSKKSKRSSTKPGA